jgi:hypothetical protein
VLVMSCFANFCFCSANSISALPLLKRGSKYGALAIFSLSLSLSLVCVHLDFYHSSCLFAIETELSDNF